MLPARPATGDLHAISISNRAIAAVRVVHLRICLRLTRCEYRDEEQGSGRFLDGLVERFVGPGWLRIPGLTGQETITATRCTSPSVTHPPARIRFSMKRLSTIRRSTPVP